MWTIILILVGIFLTIGFIRVLFSPVNGIGDFFMQVMLLDWMSDAIGGIFESLAGSDDWD